MMSERIDLLDESRGWDVRETLDLGRGAGEQRGKGSEGQGSRGAGEQHATRNAQSTARTVTYIYDDAVNLLQHCALTADYNPDAGVDIAEILDIAGRWGGTTG